ncbi:hypothetical protein [Uliginosibacterium sp. H1]|uniref:hypothetical protein n=1 Tax=Uliginosibacterium sp. H1 TaxID=3114757 RepID=UPI002E18538E|nr:hypothetical protein [Uliginosibacterium sp. H1]
MSAVLDQPSPARGTLRQVWPQTRVVAPLLCCPVCGDSRSLHAADELPAGLTRILTACPDCAEDVGTDSLFVFEDGRSVREEAPAALRPSFHHPSQPPQDCTT